MNRRRKHQFRTFRCEQMEQRVLLAADIELVSTGSPGDPTTAVGNGSSTRPAMTADGRFVAFRSVADNLVPGDTNGGADIFVKDLTTGALQIASVSFKGELGDGSVASAPPSISADGRYVAFASRATNLVQRDENGGTADVFVKDMITGKVTLASQTASQRQSTSGAESPVISADGRYVAYIGGGFEEGSGYGIYRKDLRTNQLELVAEGWSWEVSISADGAIVVYGSGFIGDIQARDMRTGTTILVTAASDGTPANNGAFPGSISADGRYVAFGSYATNLVNDDQNGSFADIFVKDLITGEVRLVSNAPGGTAGNDAAFFASLSDDGRYVAFQSYASNLVPDDTNGFGADAFVRDLLTDELIMVSNTPDTTIHDRSFARPVISNDGRYVAFDSRAPGHVPDDTNNAYDIFRADTNDAWSVTSELPEQDVAQPNTVLSTTLFPRKANAASLSRQSGSSLRFDNFYETVDELFSIFAL